jgi:RNA polymerase sigma-70 factor (ECF subfamily)
MEPGDYSLTENLVAQYYPYIVRLALSILQDAEEAEDVAQETFITALVHIEDCDADANFKAWLSTIAVNKCRDLLRKRKTRQKFTDVWQNIRMLGQTQTPEDIAEQSSTQTELWTAVNTLNDKHRLPILLRYVHNLSIREISQVLNVKEGTIHSRLHNACKKLAGQMEFNLDKMPVVEEVSR